MPQLEKLAKQDYIISGKSPNSRKKALKPRQAMKLAEKLSTPIVRIPVDRGIPPNNKEHHDLFVGVLRDPSPISPERHGTRNASRNGAVSARLAASFDKYHPLGSQSTLSTMKS